MAVIERKIKLNEKKNMVEGGKVTAVFLSYLLFCVTLKEKQKKKRKKKYMITFIACDLGQLTNLFMSSLNFHSY